MNIPSWPTIHLAGLPFAAITESETVAHIVDSATRGHGGWLVTPNLDILRQCVTAPGICAIARSADLLVADGMPLIWASRLQGTPLPGRVAGSNLVEGISAQAAKRGLKLFLLGGNHGVADQAQRVLRARHPGIRIVGTYCPPLGFENDLAQLAHIRTLLLESGPDIVYVGLGFPKQEQAIQAFRSAAPSAWWLGIGISLSFCAGHISRAPVWMQRMGLEWAHRLIQEPRRLARRYLLHGFPFAARLFSMAVRARMRPKA